jgi:hypothetical protein
MSCAARADSSESMACRHSAIVPSLPVGQNKDFDRHARLPKKIALTKLEQNKTIESNFSLFEDF